MYQTTFSLQGKYITAEVSVKGAGGHTKLGQEHLVEL